MAARKKPEAKAEEDTATPKAVVGNLGTPSTGKREPVVEKLANGTEKVTY